MLARVAARVVDGDACAGGEFGGDRDVVVGEASSARRLRQQQDSDHALAREQRYGDLRAHADGNEGGGDLRVAHAGHQVGLADVLDEHRPAAAQGAHRGVVVCVRSLVAGRGVGHGGRRRVRGVRHHGAPQLVGGAPGGVEVDQVDDRVVGERRARAPWRRRRDWPPAARWRGPAARAADLRTRWGSGLRPGEKTHRPCPNRVRLEPSSTPTRRVGSCPFGPA